jgi:hypothetical protein
LAGEGVFVVSVFVGLQPGFDRIAADIAHAANKVVGIAYETVEVVFLPEGAMKAEQLVQAFRGVAFPTRQDFAEQFTFMQRREHMDVIRHENPGVKVVALVIKES